MRKMSGRVSKTKALLAKTEFNKLKNELLARMEDGSDKRTIRGYFNQLSDLLGVYLQETDYLGQYYCNDGEVDKLAALQRDVDLIDCEYNDIEQKVRAYNQSLSSDHVRREMAMLNAELEATFAAVRQEVTDIEKSIAQSRHKAPAVKDARCVNVDMADHAQQDERNDKAQTTRVTEQEQERRIDTNTVSTNMPVTGISQKQMQPQYSTPVSHNNVVLPYLSQELSAIRPPRQNCCPAPAVKDVQRKTYPQIVPQQYGRNFVPNENTVDQQAQSTDPGSEPRPGPHHALRPAAPNFQPEYETQVGYSGQTISCQTYPVCEGASSFNALSMDSTRLLTRVHIPKFRGNK